ncbi:palmitoyltransferase for Vac8p [Sporothrix epigloea]|uniref:Palmitoyltransferase n=1 Tax=Sporothrix epigloea TaxID=1892477 RepID=A0ABP0DN19_9PEZI
MDHAGPLLPPDDFSHELVDHSALSESRHPGSPSHDDMIGRRLARRVERACCTCATYIPLAFVYSISTWAVWVIYHLATTPSAYARSAFAGPWCAPVGIVLYVMMMWSYTAAVFTTPGSTTNDQGYSTVPTNNGSPFNGLADHQAASLASAAAASSLTVKSNGEIRYCKKCQARKPDRAHHCSTCRRCILKMDHHCPWLANCIGLRNNKMFILFLIYTTLFSLFSFVLAGSWVWTEIVNDVTYASSNDTLMPVQYIMLTVVGAIFGLAVGLFTAWHIILASRGQTTIECMEKTRYSSSLRGSMPFTAAATVAGAIGEGLSTLSSDARAAAAEHGVLPPQYGRQMAHLQGHGGRPRDEEMGLFAGVEGAHDDDSYNDDMPNNYASESGRRLTYNELERYRAQKRHEAYLDELDSAKMPHAFDLGVRRNLRQMFGATPWLWPLPIYTSTGDGWSWEPSPRWVAARERMQQDRDAQRARERAAGWGDYEDDLPSSSAAAPPIIVTSATPPRHPIQPPLYHPRQPYQKQNTAPPPKLGLHPAASNRPAPSRYRRSPLTPSKADRILGRNPNQGYADTETRAAGNNVALLRLSATGQTLPDDDTDLFGNDTDEEADEEETATENDAEDDGSSSKADSAPAAGAFSPVSPSQQHRHQPSTLRAHWMPDPTSGLLREASLSPVGRTRSPKSSGAATPIAPAGSVNGSEQCHKELLGDVDDGSVD